jgi:hypothetical protein
MLFPRWFWIGLTATVIALAGISLAVAQPSIGFDPLPGVVIQDEGTTQGRARTLNCSGADITCSVSAGVATLNATGGAGGSFTGIEVEVDFGSINTAYANFSVTDATVSPGFLREFMNPEVNAFYHVMLMSRSLAQAIVETLPKESGDELSRRIELRDAVAEELNRLYTELLRCRPSSLRLAARTVYRD